ncbi:rRNA processing protein [Enterococcus faecium]|nr:rRNA processing protein [Enterococcus faecium]
MTNYNGEKGKRLRGSMAPKSDDKVALAGTNSGETEEKQEALSGTNSGEEKEVALYGSNAVEEDEPTKPNRFEKEVEKLTDEVKEKFEELTSKKEHKD